MTRFNPFTAILHLMLLLVVVVITILEDILTYLAKFIKKIKRNYRYIIYGDY